MSSFYQSQRTRTTDPLPPLLERIAGSVARKRLRSRRTGPRLGNTAGGTACLGPCHAVSMRLQRDRDRQARLRQFYESLPPTQQGVVVSVLLAYASATVAVDGALAIAALRGARRSLQQRRSGPVSAVRAGISPELLGAAAAAAVQWAVAKWLIRVVDTGQAQAWLERQERWLAGPAAESLMKPRA